MLNKLSTERGMLFQAFPSLLNPYLKLRIRIMVLYHLPVHFLGSDLIKIVLA